jgi:hypothetical protein
MKQTAVEWLFEQYVNKGIITIESLKKAKSMEKKHLKHAYNSDRPNLCAFTEGTAFKEYHNENFKP